MFKFLLTSLFLFSSLHALSLETLQKEILTFNKKLKKVKLNINKNVNLKRYSLDKKYFTYYYDYSLTSFLSDEKDVKISKAVINNIKSYLILQSPKKVCEIPLVKQEILPKGIKPRMHFTFLFKNKKIDSFSYTIPCNSRE